MVFRYCTGFYEGALFVYLFIAVVLSLTMFPMWHTFIQTEIIPKTKNKKWMTALAIIVLAVTTPLMPMGIAHAIYLQCIDPTEEGVGSIALLLVSIQVVAMQIVWFYRLYVAFNTSFLKLSKCCIYFYIANFVIQAILLSFLLMASMAYQRDLGAALSTLSGVVSIGTQAFILHQFTSRLRKIMRLNDQSDMNPGFRRTITKSFLCVALSFVMTILDMIGVIVGFSHNQGVGASDRKKQQWAFVSIVAHLVMALDRYSNCLFVMLSFSGFDEWYVKLLGWLHKRLDSNWKKNDAASPVLSSDTDMEVTSTVTVNTTATIDSNNTITSIQREVLKG